MSLQIWRKEKEDGEMKDKDDGWRKIRKEAPNIEERRDDGENGREMKRKKKNGRI